MSRTEAGDTERLASIHIYPMKGTRAVDLTESLVEPWGLAATAAGCWSTRTAGSSASARNRRWPG